MNVGEKQPWDANCDATKVALERFLRALIVVHGHFTDSFALASAEKATRSVTVFFRIWLHRGTEERFSDLAKVALPTKPPQAHLNGGL